MTDVVSLNVKNIIQSIKTNLGFEFNNPPELLIGGDNNAFKHNNYRNVCGIYMCVGIFESTTLKVPIYIGSSNNIFKRITKSHIGKLNAGNHINPPLQYSWNKHRKEKFYWFLIETVCITELLSREQWYLDKIDPSAVKYRGFNISSNASAPMTGRKHTEESLNKMRTAQVKEKNGRWNAVVTDETKRRISESLRGDKHPMFGKKIKESTKKKLLELHEKEYKFIDPTGKIFTGKNIVHFCIEHKLHAPAMSAVLRGEKRTYKGWRNGYNPIMGDKEYKYNFISPDGVLFSGVGISKFAKERNMNKKGLTRLHSGETKAYKGWKNYSETIPFNAE